MKRYGRLIGLMLVMLIAGPGIVNAQRGMRRMMPDSVRMNRMKRGFEKYPLEQMAPGFDTLKLNHPGPGMGPFGMDRMHWGMFPGPGYGMRGWMWWGPMRERMWRGFGPGWMDMPHRGMRPFWSDSTGTWRPGPWRFNDIPNLTEKQKKQIQDLRQNQQEEVRKFREDMMQKMRSMREFNHQKIMDLLTPEQKKWIEKNMPQPAEK
jgi:hypothetical protein